MKQRIDKKQKRELDKLDIRITGEHDLWEYTGAPETIGELIEWIRDNHENWYKDISYAISEIEPLDALVALAIKIQEQK